MEAYWRKQVPDPFDTLSGGLRNIIIFSWSCGGAKHFDLGIASEIWSFSVTSVTYLLRLRTALTNAVGKYCCSGAGDGEAGLRPCPVAGLLGKAWM